MDPGFSKWGGGGGGINELDACCLYKHTFIVNKTKRLEVVNNSASPKRPFFFLSCHFPPILTEIPINTVSSSPKILTNIHVFTHSYIHPFFYFPRTYVESKGGEGGGGGAYYTCTFIFLLGHPSLAQKGGACA